MKLSRIQRNRDFCNGADAVKDAGERYLPLTGSRNEHDPNYQSDEAYCQHKLDTEFFPAAAKTLQSFSGLVFRKPAKFDAPDAFKPLEATMTMSAQTLEEVAKWAFREYAITNGGAILVDHPPAIPGLSLADAIKNDIRPFLALYRAEAVEEPEFMVRGGAKRLKSVTLIDDEETKRRLELIDSIYTVTFIKLIDGKWSEVSSTTPMKRGKPMDEIPIAFLSDGDEGASFDDLVQTNWVHYRLSAKHIAALNWCHKPQPYIAGLDDDVTLSMAIGSLWKFKEPNTKPGYLEFTGDGIPAIERQLQRLEDHMTALGSRMLGSDKKAAEAEETIARRQASENSILASMARHISAKLETALKIAADWFGVAADEVSYALNIDFVPTPIDPALLGQLVTLKGANLLPLEDLFDALQRGEIISEAVDFETYRTRLESEQIDPPISE